MKRLLMIMLVLVFASTAFGKLTPNQAYKKGSSNFSLTFAGTSAERDAVPSGVWTKREGDHWWNTTTNTMTVYNGSTWVSFTGGGTTLDGAYNFGGNGAGRAIVASDGAVAISNTDADTAFLLTLNASPGSSAALGGMEITLGSNSTESGIEFENSGSGNDILGSGDTWAITKAGASTFVGVTTSGELLVSAADVLFDDTYDVAWDTSRDQMIWQDNAVLGLGGAHDAAADITFVYDGTDLLMEAATADDKWKIGATTNFDIQIYGDTATDYVLYDTSAENVQFNGFDLTIMDDDIINYGDSDEFKTYYDEASTDNLITVALNANDAVQVGDGTTNTDWKAMGATASTYALWDASADEMLFNLADLKMSQGSQIEFIDVTDGLTDWTIDLSTDEVLLFLPTETTDDQSFNIGNATNTSDFRLFGATASTVVFDASGDLVIFNAYDIRLQDSDILNFGDSDDITATFDGSDFKIDAIIADEGFLIGDTTTGFDMTYAFETAGQFRTDYDGDFINLTDDMEFRFGTGASSDGDFKISSGATNILAIEQVVADTGTMTIGANGTDIPLTWYAETAGAEVIFTGDTVLVDGVDITISDDDVLNFGDSAEVTMQYDEDGFNGLQTSGLAYGSRKLIENVITNDVLTTSADPSGKIFVVDGNTVTIQLTLPSVGAGDDGFEYTFCDVNEVAASDVQIEPADSDSINGTADGFSSDGADKLPCNVTLIYNHSNTDWVALVSEEDTGTAAWNPDS